MKRHTITIDRAISRLAHQAMTIEMKNGVLSKYIADGDAIGYHTMRESIKRTQRNYYSNLALIASLFGNSSTDDLDELEFLVATECGWTGKRYTQVMQYVPDLFK